MEIWRKTTSPVNATAFNLSQFSGAYPPGMEGYWWNLARNKIIAHICSKYLLRDEMILEIGCGSGIVTDYLKGHNWNISGVDLGQPDVANKTRPYMTYGKEAKDLPEETRKDIEVIGLFDVLEHIPEPTKFTSQLLGACPNTKLLVVTVPARQEIWTNFDEYYGHCRRYSLRQLDDEMMSVGLEKVWAGYFFHSLYFAILFSKAFTNHRKVCFDPPRNCANIMFHRFLAEALIWEFFLTPKCLPGSSIIAVYALA
jgi:SAM-dependent methyltransferase